jgi:DNA-binding NarL/FixJ family response regulator
MLRTEKKIRVLICNKCTLFREGIKALLIRGDRFEVAGEASSAREAVEKLAKLRPDVVLMDLTLPDQSGWETIRRMKSISPDIDILIVPLNDDKPQLFRCLQAGAAGHVRTNDFPLDLKNAIQNVYRRGAHAA